MCKVNRNTIPKHGDLHIHVFCTLYTHCRRRVQGAAVGSSLVLRQKRGQPLQLSKCSSYYTDLHLAATCTTGRFIDANRGDV